MNLSSQNKKYILASKSPRRQLLLKGLGLSFEVKTKEVDESFPEKLKAQEIPLFLCKKKAHAFKEQLLEEVVLISADTIVWINDQVLNKPQNHTEAFTMLKLLSGNMHQVYTGVCLKSKYKTNAFYVSTKVYFKKLTDRAIENYIINFKPFDKAGSYGAQECLPSNFNPCSEEEMNFLAKINKSNLIEGSISKSEKNEVQIEKIEGSYFNVMGLPLVELYTALTTF